MSEVKKAIIIASGLGSRMYPYTKVESKLLIPLLNKPVVEYLVEELAASGIKEVIIVSNHTEKLKQFFKEDERLNQLLKSLKRDDLIKKLHHVELLLDVEIIRQDQPMGWVHELWYARDHIKKEPFVVLFSDVLYKSKVPAAKQAIREFDKTNKNVSATARYVFKPNVFDLLQKEPFRLGEYLVGQDIFDRLMEKDDLVRINIKGEFYDVGNPLSYMKTETAFALSEPEIKDEYWKFIRKLVLEKELGKDYSKVEFLKKQFRSTYKEFLKQKFYSDSKLKVELREKYRKFLKKVVWASYNGEYQKLRVFLENMIK